MKFFQGNRRSEPAFIGRPGHTSTGTASTAKHRSGAVRTSRGGAAFATEQVDVAGESAVSGRPSWAAGLGEAGVVAPKENQRVARIKLRGKHFADYDCVVS